MEIFKINRFALEQLVLINSPYNYVPSEGIVCLEVTSRWTSTHIDDREPLDRFFKESGWFNYLTKSVDLVVPSNLGRILMYPVFYNGQPFLCFNFPFIPLVNPGDFKSKFIPESVRIVTENSISRLVKYGKFNSAPDYLKSIKDKNFDEIKSIIDDLIQLNISMARLGYTGKQFIIDDKLYTFLEGKSFRPTLGMRRSFLGNALENLQKIFKDNPQTLAYITGYLDTMNPANFVSEIIRINPEYKVNEIDSKDITEEELTSIMKKLLGISLSQLDMLMRILSEPSSRKEFMFRASTSTQLFNDIIRVYHNYFDHTRIGFISNPAAITRAKTFVRQFFTVSNLYSYQEKFNAFIEANPIIVMATISIPKVIEKFSLLLRSYNTLKAKSEDAARRSLLRWTNYVATNPSRTSNSLIIGENKYSAVIFYNTPFYNAISFSSGDYNIQEFPYLNTQDKELIDAFLRGLIMPMTYYAGLSDQAFEVLSGPGSFLDLYENLEARKWIDLSFILGTNPEEYILKGQLGWRSNLPGVDELMRMLGSEG